MTIESKTDSRRGSDTVPALVGGFRRPVQVKDNAKLTSDELKIMERTVNESPTHEWRGDTVDVQHLVGLGLMQLSPGCIGRFMLTKAGYAVLSTANTDSANVRKSKEVNR